jgi:hypothetical protein
MLQENPQDNLQDNCLQQFGFNVHTIEGGYNCGREYCFCEDKRENAAEWIKLLNVTYREASKRHAKRTMLEKYRVRRFLLSTFFPEKILMK